MDGRKLQGIMIWVGVGWIVASTVIILMSESPMSTSDLIRYYGMTACAHVWLVGSIIVGAVRAYSK